jgi:hypothetical protein
MLSIISNYLENKLLNYFLRNTSYTPPSNVYLALYASNPTDADTATEISVGSYTRVVLPSFNVDFDTSVATLESPVIFPTATSSWSYITHWGIKDSLIGGNLLLYGAFVSSALIQTGNTFVVDTNNLIITLSGNWTQTSAHGVLEWILNNGSFNNPLTGMYIKLGKNFSNPASTDYFVLDDDYWTEISGTGYSRKSAWGTDAWTAPSNGISTNVSDIVFTTYALSDWGLIEGIVIVDYLNNSMLWGKISPSITVITGDSFKIPAGTLTVSFQ